MAFVVDKIYEDSFYVNALLGLPKILDKNKKFGVKNQHLTRFSPAYPEEILAWENRYAVTLPPEMKRFYCSTNGFLFRWTYGYSREKVEMHGRIEINSIQNLKQIFGYETNSDPGITLYDGRYHLKLGLTSKVFEIAPIEETRGTVVLVYVNARFAPTIWLCDYRRCFYYLTNDFCKYFRMAIAHLGIPCWQHRFTPSGCPAWAESMFRILAPHLLPFKQSAEGLTRSLKTQNISKEFIVNKLNPNVFNKDYVCVDDSAKYMKKLREERDKEVKRKTKKSPVPSPRKR